MLEVEAEGHVDSIIYKPLGSVGELQGVQDGVSKGFEVEQNNALKGLPDHRAH